MKNELRIGNLVTDEFWDTFQKTITVESINDKGINLSIENSDDYPEMQDHWIEPYYEFDKLRGIPLTEDWLKRFGFDIHPISSTIDISYFPKEELKLLCVTINQGIMIRCGAQISPRTEDELTVIYNTDIRGPLTVHFLQNAYWMITGKELTLTL